MTSLAIILLVALAIVAWLRQRSPTPVLNGLLIALAVACLGATVALLLKPPMVAARLWAEAERVHEATGFEMGRAVGQAFPQGGDVLVVLDGLAGEFPAGGVPAAQVRGLRAGFGQGKLQAVPFGYAPVSDAEAMDIRDNWLFGVLFEKINEWFRAHSGAVAVVAFTTVGTGPHGKPPAQIPPLFVVGAPALEHWMDWVKRGLWKRWLFSASISRGVWLGRASLRHALCRRCFGIGMS